MTTDLTPVEQELADHLVDEASSLILGYSTDLPGIVRRAVEIIEADLLRRLAAELREMAAARAVEIHHTDPLWRSGVLVDADWLEKRADEIAATSGEVRTNV